MTFSVIQEFKIKGAVQEIGAILTLTEDQAAKLSGYVVPAKPFDPDRAHDRIRRVQDELNSSGPWPEHLSRWLELYHPAMLQKIRNTTAAVDDAFKNNNDRALDRALDEYRAAWLAGLQLYRQQEGQQ